MKRVIASLPYFLIGLVLMACNANTSGEDHLNNAREFFRQADYSAAVIELKNSLQKDPNNPEARTLLGQVYFELGDYQDAEKELTRALETGVKEAAIAPILAQVLVALGEDDKVQAMSEDGLDPADRSTVHAAKGLSILRQGNTALAVEVIDQSLANDPVSPYALVAGARVAMMEQSVDKARGFLGRALQLDPVYAPAWDLSGDIESQEQQFEQAEVAYKKAVELSANNFDQSLKLVMIRIYRQDIESAQVGINALKTVSPNHPGVNFAQGLVYLQQRSIGEAKIAFEEASLYAGGNPFALYYLAAINWGEGNLFIARQNVMQFLAIVPDDPRGLRLAATLELQEGNFARVEEILQPLLTINPDDTLAMNLMAKALIGQGRREEGIELLVRVADLQPESVQAQATLGAGYLAIGEEALGVETLQASLQLDPEFQQADILLVLQHLRQQDFDAAIKAAQEYRDRNPTSVTPYNLLGRVYLAANNVQAAQAAFNQAIELVPGDPAANLSLARFALQQQDYVAARDYYQRVLKHHPKNLQSLMKLAESYALEGMAKPMIDTLQRAIEAKPDSVQPRFVLASYYLTQGQPERVAVLLEPLSDEQKGLPTILGLLAISQLDQGNYNQASMTIDQLISFRPEAGQFHYLKAQAYAGLGDTGKAEVELKKAVELSPDHFYARLALARMALMNGDDALYEQHLASLKEVSPDHPDIALLEINSANRSGDTEFATQLRERLFEKGPTTATLVSLAQQKQSAGDSEGAIALVQTWLADRDSDILARLALASFFAKAGRTSEAAEQYRVVIEMDPKNQLALNNLAWILKDDDPAQALRYAEKASELAPNSVSVLDTLAIVLMKNNELKQARRVMDRARADLPDNPKLRFHDAQIRLAEGDTDMAVSMLKSILASEESFSERDAAEALLQQVQ